MCAPGSSRGYVSRLSTIHLFPSSHLARPCPDGLRLKSGHFSPSCSKFYVEILLCIRSPCEGARKVFGKVVLGGEQLAACIECGTSNVITPVTAGSSVQWHVSFQFGFCTRVKRGRGRGDLQTVHRITLGAGEKGRPRKAVLPSDILFL